MKIRLIDPERLIPDAHTAAEASVDGVERLIKQHLRDKNNATQPNRYGLPKTNYYAEAAKDVAAGVDGNKVNVEISYPGISLHYEGGTVYPTGGKKNIAIPIDPAVAGIWPSEFDPTENHEKTFITPGGAIGEKETGKILYILLPKATIPEDKTVLPTDAEIFGAVENALMEAVS